MPAASPYLDDLLQQLTANSQDIRKEIAFQKDLLDPLTLAAHGNRLAMRERRRRDLRQLEQAFTETQDRWDERLHRIEEWKHAADTLQSEETALQNLISASVWLQKARAYQEPFLARFERRAQRLDEQQQAFRATLEAWQAVLDERAAGLEELAQKLQTSLQPLFVSRARKQPELEFVRDQGLIEEALGQGLKQMRTSLRLSLDRLKKASVVVERQASGAEIFYEMHKQEVLAGLKESHQSLEKRREKILEDALLYESCRHLLRKLREFAQGLRCIEDIPQQSGPAWKKILKVG